MSCQACAPHGPLSGVSELPWQGDMPLAEEALNRQECPLLCCTVCTTALSVLPL